MGDNNMMDYFQEVQEGSPISTGTEAKGTIDFQKMDLKVNFCDAPSGFPKTFDIVDVAGNLLYLAATKEDFTRFEEMLKNGKAFIEKDRPSTAPIGPFYKEVDPQICGRELWSFVSKMVKTTMG